MLPGRFSLNSWLSLIVGGVASGVLAYVVGTPILRLKGYYLAIATLGLGILIAMVLNNEGWLTGGPDGIEVPRPFVFGWRLRGLEVWYWITGGVTVVGAWLAANVLQARPAGRCAHCRYSETAAQIAGVNVARVKLVAFVLSAVYASVAGSCFSFSAGLITPDKAGFLYSVELVTMVVIGGMGSILGSVVGAAVLVALPQLLASFQNYEQIMLGLVMMAMMIFLRLRDCPKPDVLGIAVAPVNLLDVERLAIDFGGVKAVDGVSFVIDKAQVFSIIGPNGAGKTTLFNLLVRPLSWPIRRTGSASRRGHNGPGAASAGCPRRVAHLSKPAELFTRMTVQRKRHGRPRDLHGAQPAFSRSSYSCPIGEP